MFVSETETDLKVREKYEDSDNFVQNGQTDKQS